MFYLRLNKVRILNNREMLGKAEIQFMSFVTVGESDLPMLKDFFATNDENTKRELVKQAISTVVNSRIVTPIQKFKDNQTVYFGDTGYIVYKSQEIPFDFNWMFMAIELDDKTRSNAALLGAILTDDNVSMVVNTIATLAGTANPVAGAIAKLATFVAKATTRFFKNDRDDQAGLFVASFVEREHYPNGKRDKQDVPDLTGNMFIDYTIFAYKE